MVSSSRRPDWSACRLGTMNTSSLAVRLADSIRPKTNSTLRKRPNNTKVLRKFIRNNLQETARGGRRVRQLPSADDPHADAAAENTQCHDRTGQHDQRPLRSACFHHVDARFLWTDTHAWPIAQPVDHAGD